MAARIALTVLLFAVFLGGCTTTTNNFAPTAAGASIEGPSSSPSVYDTRAFLRESCVVQYEALPAFLIPVAIAAGSKAIDVGLGYITKLLAAEKEKYKASYSGRAASHFYQKQASAEPVVSVPLHCVIIARGWFGPPPTATTPDEVIWNAPTLRAFGLTSRPDFYFQMLLEISPERSYFRLVPNYLDFHRPLAERGQDQAKSLQVTLLFENPAQSVADASTAAFAVGDFVFREIRPGTILGPAVLRDITTHWMPLPTLVEDQFARVPPGSVLTPFSMLATVREEGEVSDLLLAASDIYAGSNEALGKALKDLLEQAVKPADEETQ
jgi:hypothetical protein